MYGSSSFCRGADIILSAGADRIDREAVKVVSRARNAEEDRIKLDLLCVVLDEPETEACDTGMSAAMLVEVESATIIAMDIGPPGGRRWPRDLAVPRDELVQARAYRSPARRSHRIVSAERGIEWLSASE
jgi:hypothetical protein